MYVLYDMLFVVFGLFYLPYFIIKRKYHGGFIQRLGILPKDLINRAKEDRIIWIHAVSVGEVMAAMPLWDALRKELSGYKIVFSTITKTGNDLAKSFAKEDEAVIYLPLDLSFIAKIVINKIKPKILLILETEVWPNIITQAYRQNIPTVLLNGRISDKSYWRYRIVKIFLKPVFKKITLFLMQGPRDASRIISLGAALDRVGITGNMKFDQDIQSSPDKSAVSVLKLKGEERLLVAGSTHRGEEKIILEIFKEITKEIPHLRLLIAPRHIERIPELEKLVIKKGLMPLRISSLNFPLLPSHHPLPIFLLDTIGQLRNFYSSADIVIVGGSFAKKGGHNVIEPAIFSKPIIIGKYFFHFQDIVKIFLEKQALIVCRDKRELRKGILELIKNLDKASALGKKAKEVVLIQRGVTLKNLAFIKNLLA